MFCQNCLSPESSLVDMRTSFFIFNDQQIDYIKCFTYCKSIKIEDEQVAKICSICMRQLETEYALKCNESAIKEEPYNHPTSNDADPAKLEVKIDVTTDATASYQIVFLESEIKDEPELIIEDEGR
jgi:hypothetical protein